MVPSLLLVFLLNFSDVFFAVAEQTWTIHVPGLSQNASISNIRPPRWSDYDAPTPGVVVNVATENDVLVTVQFCIAENIPFLAQNGGHGWSSTLDNLMQNGVLINLRGLNSVTFSADKTKATVGGGAIISDVINAAYAEGVQVETGNCNCVGALGAALGGGYGNLIGLTGLAVDNILSMNVVMADGSLHTITSKNEDLFWALRGAGPNFGIVTSAVLIAYPVTPDQNLAWQGSLGFTQDKIESLVQAINDLVLQPKMNIFLYYANSGTPTVIINVFYYGNETQGKAAFASIYAIGPYFDGTSVLAYPHWNDGTDAAGDCINGGRKPAYGAGLAKMVPTTWRAIWNEYVSFISVPGAENSLVALEAYSLFKARSVPDSSSSFPFRSTVNFNGFVVPWYNDSSLDPQALAFGSKVRDLWRSTDDLASNSTYINFAHGDEPLPTVYGGNVARLQGLKVEYDPHGRFNNWFPLS
ncbi:MAG: hypothetical protein MMC33_008214 [Icmadophila ericetorum]|nr:hypothetical protein [Icmadophila ericetorum]